MKKDLLIKIIEDSARTLGVEELPVIEIEIPRNDKFGDISTTIAMNLSRQLKKSPKIIASEIVDSIQEKTLFEKIEIAGPGFINFTFSKEYLDAEINRLLKEKSSFLRSDIGKGKKVQIEFISANPTGPLHLGHGRGGATGNALANLLEAAGFEVEREYYINDAGKQVMLLGLSVFARYLQLLGKEYPFPEEGYRGAYIEDLAKDILEKYGMQYSENPFDDVSDFFTDYSFRKILSDIEEDLKIFGIRFDTWRSERELYQSGEVSKALDDLQSRGLLYEKDGATWFKATAFGDDKDRVVRKKDGEYTYFTSDIAYHRKKIEKQFDKLIDIWGADHHGYIPRVQSVIEALGYPKEKLKVVLVQMVTLLRGGKPVQMSKRAGEFITLREVIEEVGADITKFIFLTRRPDSHLEFDLEIAKIQSSENPVYYVQYANARINSIFSHAREKDIGIEGVDDINFNLLSEPEEMRLMKKLLLYPMIFEGAVKNNEPHRITFYLQELAGNFHPYYNKHRVVTDERDLTQARLALCEAVRIVIRDGLEILGVTAPEKM
jgi:arginyl-tRNA synthetase